MSILVICPSCGAKFNVSEKFAGRQGPCPKCKGTIRVPNPDDVKVHMPADQSVAKDSKGRPVTKPLARKETKLSRVQVVALVGGCLLVMAIAWLLGRTVELANEPLIAGGALLVVSVPIEWLGYQILRNDELEPYRGRTLWLRVGICGVLHALLWGVYALVPADFVANGWAWLGIAPPFLAAGATVSFATLDLDLENAFFHYCFYLLLTMTLRWLAGMPWVWQVAV